MTQLGLKEVRKEGCPEVADRPGIRQDSGTKNNHGVSIGFIRLSKGSRTACPGKNSKITLSACGPQIPRVFLDF